MSLTSFEGEERDRKIQRRTEDKTVSKTKGAELERSRLGSFGSGIFISELCATSFCSRMFHTESHHSDSAIFFICFTTLKLIIAHASTSLCTGDTFAPTQS
ncbi:hypothetical protein Bca4012_072768 [Brassica carinata]